MKWINIGPAHDVKAPNYTAWRVVEYLGPKMVQHHIFRGPLAESEAKRFVADGEHVDKDGNPVVEEEPTGYMVSVSNIFEDAESPEDAVRQMVEWLQENAHAAGYRVEPQDGGTSSFIDAERDLRREGA